MFNIINQTVEFQVHRLPNGIKKFFLEDYFNHFGCVVNVRIESMFCSMNEAKSSGFRMEEINRRSIQFVVKFNGDCKALITMPGRPQKLKVHLKV